MDAIKFYSLIEFEPDPQLTVLGINLANDFPGSTKIIAGSVDHNSYTDCAQACLNILQAKLEILKQTGTEYKIYFEKNQFDGNGDFEENEVVKIYISDSKQKVYNSLLKARIFFVKPDPFAYFFEVPSTLQ